MRSMSREMTDLCETLSEAVNCLQSFRIRDRKNIWPEPNNVSMLSVKSDLGDVRAPPVDIDEPPPICYCREKWSGVFVEPMVISIAGKMEEDRNTEDGQPVSHDKGQNNI